MEKKKYVRVSNPKWKITYTGINDEILLQKEYVKLSEAQKELQKMNPLITMEKLYNITRNRNSVDKKFIKIEKLT